MSSTPKRNLVLAITLVGMLGCGVSDYEKQMDVQRQRLQDFDKANAMLEDPLEPPTMQDPKTKAEAPAWPFDLFLRLPKGYGSTLKEKEKAPYGYPFACFRYVGPEPTSSIFVAAELIPSVAAKDKGADPSDRFRMKVRNALEIVHARTAGTKLLVAGKLVVQAIDVKRFATNSAVEGDVSYDLITYHAKEPVVFQAYFLKDGGDKKVCIAFQRPLKLADEAAFKKSLDLCLGSLELSSERRAQYLRAKAMVKK